MSKFEVSEEFKLFQAQTQSAFKDAGEAEHGAGIGCDLPPGTQGKGSFSGATAGKSKAKVEGSQSIPGKPFIIMEIEVSEPASHQGRKYARYFDLSHHERYSSTQKISDWWDFMEDAGCPREVRNSGDPNQGFAWAAQAPRHFTFTVEEGYKGRRDIKPVPPLGPMPTASATEQAMAANTAPAPAGTPVGLPAGVTVGATCKAYDQLFILRSVEGNFCTLTNMQNGAAMPNVPLAAIQSV